MKKFLFLFIILMTVSSCYVYKTPVLEEGTPEPTIEKEIVPNQFYQIYSGGKAYKIKAVSWEEDSLVAHVNMKEKNLKKFHKGDITEVEHRVFSRGRSDATTFGIYGAVAALALILFSN